MTDLVLITDQDESYLISKSSVASVHWDNNYSSTTIIMKERRKRYQDEEAFNQVYHIKLPFKDVQEILTSE